MSTHIDGMDSNTSVNDIYKGTFARLRHMDKIS